MSIDSAKDSANDDSTNKAFEIEVSFSSDKMEAYVNFIKQQGERIPDYNEMLLILKEKGVLFGYMPDIIQSIINHPVYDENICIAKGIEPVNGKDGSVEFYFKIDKDTRPIIQEDGSVDFRQLNIIESVSTDQKLCGLIPPEPPQDGMNVKGEPVKGTAGKTAILPRGKNTKISEDGQYLCSLIDGQVVYADKQISVFPYYEVNGDVDNSVGNICFVGNVTIKGNVLSGFTVETGGSVEVLGIVESAVIKAGGDIILRKGMHGLGKGILNSGKNIVAKYIENSIVEAKQDITAEAIMHSNVKCGNVLELTGKKGLLVGGNTKVGKEIRAKVIGSHLATLTELETGLDPTLRERYKSVKEEFANVENDIKKTDQAVTILKKMEQSGILNEEKKEMLVKSTRTKILLSTKYKDLREKMMEMEERFKQDLPGKIKVTGCIYPGTKITIASSAMYIKEQIQYCTLYRDGADIRVGPIEK